MEHERKVKGREKNIRGEEKNTNKINEKIEGKRMTKNCNMTRNSNQ